MKLGLQLDEMVCVRVCVCMIVCVKLPLEYYKARAWALARLPPSAN
jgi:hypothetical protein